MTDEADPRREEPRAVVADLFAEFTWLRSHAEASGEPPPEFDAWVREHPAHERELREHHAHWLAVGPLLERYAFGPSEAGDASQQGLELAADSVDLLRDVAERRNASDRYEVLEEVGRGGMGVVFKVWDRHMGRVACMKALRRQWFGSESASGVGRGALQRFVEEARIASRLTHPGIVPIHELGCDAEGRVWFTMAFVEGRDLGQVLRDARERKEPVARAVGFLLRACEAVAFAHDNGVLHRDLKPANVRVGAFGQVYVLDWGLARLMQHGGAVDGGGDDGDGGSSSSSVTRAGHAMGTIAYMSPEQARGDLAAVGPRSDVYSLGAVLYEILAARRPYERAGASPKASELLARVREQEPDPLPRDVPSDLAAVCTKAMQRDPRLRYASADELAADLRACLEGHVVTAHRTDRIERIARWVRRNRGLSAALAAGLIVAVSAAVVIEVLRARSQRSAGEVFRLAARQQLGELQRHADELWPATAELIPSYEAWLADADALLAGLAGHLETLAAIEARGRVVPIEEWIASRPGDPAVRALVLARADRPLLAPSGEEETLHYVRGDALHVAVDARIAELESAVAGLDRLEFTDARDRWWHAQLRALVDELAALADPEHGLIDGVSAEHGWGVRRRLASARAAESASADAEWARATEAIAADPRYACLSLRAQPGLVPLGPDPASGLWEFAHPQSGSVPARDPDTGELALDETSGLVFVLIPGGSFLMGAVTEPGEPHFDAAATKLQSPRQPVTLDPFFVSKYELTQAQWLRATGGNPSYYHSTSELVTGEPSGLHPIENVTWNDAVRVLGWLGLELPTEAQWEYATRAGTQTIWFTGDDVASLAGYANLSDREASRFFARNDFEADLEDPWPTHAPVNAMLPNPFGLHGTVGNVAEWCRDKIGMLGTPVRSSDGRRLDEAGRSYVRRGSSFYGLASHGASSSRAYALPTEQSVRIGCRPARRIE